MSRVMRSPGTSVRETKLLRRNRAQYPIMTSQSPSCVNSPKARAVIADADKCNGARKRSMANARKLRFRTLQESPPASKELSLGKRATDVITGVIENKWVNVLPVATSTEDSHDHIATSKKLSPSRIKTSTPLANNAVKDKLFHDVCGSRLHLEKFSPVWNLPSNHKSPSSSSRARSRLLFAPTKNREERRSRKGFHELNKRAKLDDFDDVKQPRKALFSDEISDNTKDSIINNLRWKLSACQTTYERKLEEQQMHYEKQLKQANELVSICLGKIKEAEKKVMLLPNLEMEVIVLRRKLCDARSRNLAFSASSSLCGETSEFDQTEGRKSPVGLSDENSLDQSDYEEDYPGTATEILYEMEKAALKLLPAVRPRLKSLENGTKEQTLTKSAPPDDVATTSSKHDVLRDRCHDDLSVKETQFEELENEHQKALKNIEILDDKFNNQREQVTSLFHDLNNMTSERNAIMDLENVTKYLRKQAVPQEKLGEIAYQAIYNDQHLKCSFARKFLGLLRLYVVSQSGTLL
ncbi:uncharacterized protein LOC143449862 [Clavelina lepadiformis]|uniref:uncharacterized protein LOC143449862 n=1 Tax=Clavelina lepadiformis TaxID=159417 RepID=UPI004042DFB5